MTTKEVFEQIVRDHQAMIHRIARSYEARTTAVEDLVQDIYMAIWQALPDFRGESSIRTFVARIANNRAITHVARASRMPLAVELNEHLPAPGTDPEHRAIAQNRSARLSSAVRIMPLTYRQVAMLALEGLTAREIADVLGITSNAVAIRQSRAKNWLRAHMGDMR
jgi:RNA polymerase sigma-70 factor (ECF subfamily)